ncbi:hypothetical protein CPC08DRAFT_643251, partial [Agrocybe pediades]
MATAAFIVARTPTTGLSGGVPYEAAFNMPVDVSWLRPFGCKAFALVPKDKRGGKFAPKSRVSVFIGYTAG